MYMIKQRHKGPIISTSIALFVALVAIIGFTVPLDTYTTTVYCSTNAAPQQVRLHAIAGQSLGKQRAANKAIASNPSAGCPVYTTYMLYLF